MCYRASFLAYAFWVHKNATPKNWLMQVEGPTFDVHIDVGIRLGRLNAMLYSKNLLMPKIGLVKKIDKLSI